MLRFIAGLLLSCLIAGSASAQSTDGLAELRWLIGERRGVGQGDPGTSGSERHNDSILGGPTRDRRRMSITRYWGWIRTAKASSHTLPIGS